MVFSFQCFPALSQVPLLNMTVGEAAVGTFHNIQVPVPTFTDTDTISATEQNSVADPDLRIRTYD
jgi:hypothetical protein